MTSLRTITSPNQTKKISKEKCKSEKGSGCFGFKIHFCSILWGSEQACETSLYRNFNTCEVRINEFLKLSGRALNISCDGRKHGNSSMGLEVMEDRRWKGVCAPFLFDHMNCYCHVPCATESWEFLTCLKERTGEQRGPLLFRIVVLNL